jgi:hypothetical protein
MLASIRHRLVILAMPKCASTALEEALGPEMDVILRGAPGVKHTTFRKYHRFLRPYLESYTKEPFEVVSLFREPVDWLHSWWRYRGRDNIPNPENSTRDMTFDEFVQAYMNGQQKPADIGQQARFVAAPDGTVGVDRIFRYDRLDCFSAFLKDRLNADFKLGRSNVSPGQPGAPDLPTDTRRDLDAYLATEHRIYREIAV